MPTVYFSLGSNIGDRLANLRDALVRLNSAQVLVSDASSVYETAPVGETPEPVQEYLNCVARGETDLLPEALLDYTQSIERAGGRGVTFRWGPRAIDIDILLYDGVTMESGRLTLPHPRLEERGFVLIPLYEIAPDLVLPSGQRLAAAVESAMIRNQSVRVAGPAIDFTRGNT